MPPASSEAVPSRPGRTRGRNKRTESNPWHQPNPARSNLAKTSIIHRRARAELAFRGLPTPSAHADATLAEHERPRDYTHLRPARPERSKPAPMTKPKSERVLWRRCRARPARQGARVCRRNFRRARLCPCEARFAAARFGHARRHFFGNSGQHKCSPTGSASQQWSLDDVSGSRHLREQLRQNSRFSRPHSATDSDGRPRTRNESLRRTRPDRAPHTTEACTLRRVAGLTYFMPIPTCAYYSLNATGQKPTAPAMI